MAKKKNIFNIFSSINSRDENGRTELYKAAKDGNLQKVKSYLKSGADPDIPNYQGLTPLHQAAYWGEVEIVKELLNAGANPSADNGKGWTPLHSAALAAGLDRRSDVIKLLMEHGADCKAEDTHGWSPQDYMKLWVKHDQSNLQKIRKAVNDDGFLDNTQQPDMDKLGMKKTGGKDKNKGKDKDGKLPPPHAADSGVAAREEEEIAELLRRIEERNAKSAAPKPAEKKPPANPRP